MKSYYKFKDFLLNMESKTSGESKTCGEYKQHVLKKGLPIKTGSIVETIIVNGQHIFDKNEEKNSEILRFRWFIGQLTRGTKENYEMNELKKINGSTGVSLDNGNFLKLTANNVIAFKDKIKQISETIKKVGITNSFWLKHPFQHSDMEALLKKKRITTILLLFPYEFAVIDSLTRLNQRNRNKKANEDNKLSDLERLRKNFPDRTESEIKNALRKFDGCLDMVISFLNESKK